MSFYKGIGGFVSIGGFVNGATEVNGALTATTETMTLKAGSGNIVGIIAPGDTFTIAGEAGTPTHTVSGTSLIPITANAAVVPFAPGIASGGTLTGAVVTFTSNVLAQAHDWSMTVNVADLDITTLGAAWKQSVSEVASWSGSLTVYLDNNLPTQAALTAMLTGGSPGGVLACVFLGVDSTSTGAKGFYGAAVLKNGATGVAMGKVTQLKVSFTGNGQLSENWQ